MANTDSAAAPLQIPVAQDFGKLEHGCGHYRRRCKIRAPCCDQIFPCRHCHNEAPAALSDPKDHHELVRQDVKQVVCCICNTEQEVAQFCSNCGVNMGEYFCDICKFFDDNIIKEQFHCTDCGICRVGGSQNFFHCQKCGSCYGVQLLNNHVCVENSMKNQCPVCYEYLFDSVQGTSIMNCGHTLHAECLIQMQTQNQYRCPICSKSLINMTHFWSTLDVEIANTPMPDDCQYQVTILCNDCVKTCTTPFHIFGLKCTNCSSFNTRIISGGYQQGHPTD